jgi:hypothetical protein
MLISGLFSGLLECLGLKEARFKWHSAFDVRDMLVGPVGGVTSRDLGCFMSLMRGLCRVTRHQGVWDLARVVQNDVNNFVQWGGPAYAYNAAAVGASEVVARLEAGNHRRRPTVFATNYGVVALRDAYGTLRPSGCTLIFRGDDFTGPKLMIEALVLGQRLNIGFAADGLDPEFWARLQGVFRKEIEAATSAK